MFEAKLDKAIILKRLLDVIKELVTDANFNCDEQGMTLQATDNSHVALVDVRLESSLFKLYRCDKPLPLGFTLSTLNKVLKGANDGDQVTLKVEDGTGVLSMTFKGSHTDQITQYNIKLLDIPSDINGIPDLGIDYDTQVTMPSADLFRIVRDLSRLGESVRVVVTRQGVQFECGDETLNGTIFLEPSEVLHKPDRIPKVEDVTDNDEKGIRDPVEANKGIGTMGSDIPNKNGTNAAPVSQTQVLVEGKEKGVHIGYRHDTTLLLSLKYLYEFSRTTDLSPTVQVAMSNETPIQMNYNFDHGYVRYLLAPKEFS